ncbi:hypothetical protein [Pseudomonas sp. ZS1P83]
MGSNPRRGLANMGGWLAYPGTPGEHRRRVGLWREVGGDKPYISFVHLDLAALIDELQALHEASVQHVGLHLRRSERPVAEVIDEIAEYVLPKFH